MLLSGTRAEIFLQPSMMTSDANHPPEAHGGPCWSIYSCCSPWKAPLWSRGTCPEASCSPWRFHIGTGSWEELLSVERSPCRNKFSGKTGLHGPPPWEQSVSEGLCPVERVHAGAIHGGLCLMGMTPSWGREGV